MKGLEFTLKNKVALVTGAGGGLGRAIAEVLGEAGASVFLHDIAEEPLKLVSADLGKKGIKNDYAVSDITLSGSADELANTVVKKMGCIDILVNSAGINRPQKPEDVTEKNWDDVLNINLKAMFFVSQAVGKEMIKRKSGKIVNISSQASLVALPLRAAYCSSKGGVNQLTRTLALEWAQHNILVNAVAPTFAETPLTKKMFEDGEFRKYVLDSIPLGRMVRSEEVAYAVLFLASDFSNMTTGHILTVDGGWTIK